MTKMIKIGNMRGDFQHTQLTIYHTVNLPHFLGGVSRGPQKRFENVLAQKLVRTPGLVK